MLAMLVFGGVVLNVHGIASCPGVLEVELNVHILPDGYEYMRNYDVGASRMKNRNKAKVKRE